MFLFWNSDSGTFSSSSLGVILKYLFKREHFSSSLYSISSKSSRRISFWKGGIFYEPLVDLRSIFIIFQYVFGFEIFCKITCILSMFHSNFSFAVFFMLLSLFRCFLYFSIKFINFFPYSVSYSYFFSYLIVKPRFIIISNCDGLGWNAFTYNFKKFGRKYFTHFAKSPKFERSAI